MKVVIAELPGEYAFNIGKERWRAAVERNRALGVEVEARFVVTDDDFHAAVPDADAIIGWRFPRDRLKEVARRLSFVHLTGVGIERMLPLDWLPQGTVLINSRGAQRSKFREVGLMALLMLQNKVPAFFTAQRDARWDQRLTDPVKAEHVVIVGTGASGTAIAEAARLLDMRVTGVNRTGTPTPAFDRVVPVEKLAGALPAADILVLALPLTPLTRNLIDDRMLGLLEPTAGLINVGRAAVLDHAALARRLEQGLLAGAVLDCYTEEPLSPSSPLWRVPNLVMLPHIASGAGDSFLAFSLDIFFRNAARLDSRQPLENVVDGSRGY